jgi:hypothetical protein
MKTLKLLTVACAASTLSACSTIDAISDFDWNRKGPGPSELRRAQDDRDRRLQTLQARMSTAEKKAISDTCSKQISNNAKGGSASLGEWVAAQTDCEIKLSE